MSDNNKLHQGNLMPSTNLLPAVLISVSVVIAAIAAAVLYSVMVDNGVVQSEPQEREIKNDNVPFDYFLTNNDQQSGDIYLLPNAKEETPVDAQGYHINENYVSDSHEYSSDFQTAPEPQNPNEKIAVLQSESEPTKPLTKEKAFVYPEPPTAQELLAMRRAQLNAKRRGTGTLTNITTIETVKAAKPKAPTAPTDKDFSAHEEIGKDETTYPVNLERTITADRHIPCVLIDQINSQLAGRVTCSVERNVYGFHGRKILIPAGSRAIGEHETLKKVGDERFNIIWQRIIRPDGVHIALTEAYTSDRIGSTGLEGVVNNRKWEKYGGAVLTSTVSALTQMSIPSEGSNNTRIAMESYGTDIGRVTAAMLQETMNIKPYSIVPAGERINITPTTDIWLKDTKRGAMFAPVEQPQG